MPMTETLIRTLLPWVVGVGGFLFLGAFVMYFFFPDHTARTFALMVLTAKSILRLKQKPEEQAKRDSKPFGGTITDFLPKDKDKSE